MSNTINLDSKIYNIGSKWVLISKKPVGTTNIRSFVPAGKGPESMLKFKTEAGDVPDLIITRKETIFNGARSENDRHNIQVLLQHYDVEIESLTENEKQNLVRKGVKKGSCKWILRNLEEEQIKEYESNLSLLKLRFWLMNDVDPISIKKSVYIASALGVPYKDIVDKGYDDQDKFRAQLISRIDKRVVKDPKLAEKLNEIKEQDSKLEMLFYIRQMMERRLIEIKGTLYFVGDLPVGQDEKSIIEYFSRNQKTFESLKIKLKEGNLDSENKIDSFIEDDEYNLTEEEKIQRDLEKIPI